MSQIDLFGSETPLEELSLGHVQRLLAAKERELDGPLTADEAGALIHAQRGKHDAEARCAYCAVDGADALARLRDRIPLEERPRQTRSPRLADNRGRSPSRRSVNADTVGYAHSNARDTELEAAARVLPRSGTARARVLHAIARAGSGGLTDEETSLELEMRLYTAAPRRKELLDAGWIVDSTRRRPTTTGSQAIVWILSDDGRRELDGGDPEPEL